MQTIVTLGLIVGLAFPNSPYPNQFTLLPSMKVVVRPYSVSYLSFTDAARCVPGAWDRWNPITASWQVEGGVVLEGLTVGIGHRSEHGINVPNVATESIDYLKLEYQIKQ